MFSDAEWKNLMNITNTLYRKNTMVSLSTYILDELFSLLKPSLVEFALGASCRNSIPQLKDTQVRSIYDKNFEERFEQEYENTYYTMDYLNWVFFSTESLVYRETDLINNHARHKSKFYKYYLSEFGLIYSAGIVICRNDEFLASVALYNNQQRGDFSDKDIQILNQLLPPLQLTIERILDLSKDKQKSTLNTSSYVLKNRYFLTRREIEILGCVFDGLSNSEISILLNIAPNTVKKHLSNIFLKLEVNSRTQLINFLVQNDLINHFC